MGEFQYTPGAHYSSKGWNEAGALSSVSGQDLTADDIASNKGNWELLSAADRDVIGIILLTNGMNDAGRGAIDIGLNHTGGVQPVISDILMQTPTAGLGAISPIFYLNIPSASIIEARFASSGGNPVTRVTLGLIHGSPIDGRCYNWVSTFGVSNESAFGTVIDPGASANSYGNWVSLGTTSHHMYMMNVFFGMRGNTAVTNARTSYVIGIGESGSQVTIFGPMVKTINAGFDDVANNYFGPTPVNIPENTIIWARAFSTTTDATDRLFEIAVYLMG